MGGFLLFCFFSSGISLAQERTPVDFGHVNASDFNLPASPLIDSSADAVIVADQGELGFVGNKNSFFSYVFKRNTRIKILNNRGLRLASYASELYYLNDEHNQKMDEIKASSFILLDGKVVKTSLDNKDIFVEKGEGKFMIKKFTVPGARVGAILEISFTITSSFIDDLPTWYFQEYLNCPCLRSRLDFIRPSALSYAVFREGLHKYSMSSSKEGYKTYQLSQKTNYGIVETEKGLNVSTPVITYTWIMKDLPALKIENYVYAPMDYSDKLLFHLYQYYNGEVSVNLGTNWKERTSELMGSSHFGAPLLSADHEFADMVYKITKGETSNLGKAYRIYEYVRDNISCTDRSQFYEKETASEVVRQKKGGVREMNLLLAVLLREAGFHADPVLLSTRENGKRRFSRLKYPDDEKMNYLVCRAVIDSKIYFLDASLPVLAFGKIPAECLNEYARVICDQDSSNIYFSADSIIEQKTVSVFLGNDEKTHGLLSGSYESTFGNYESIEIRERGKESYLKSLPIRQVTDLTIANEGIDSLNKLEDPVKAHFDISIRMDTSSDIFYLSPLLQEGYTKNPFIAETRELPVEMPYSREITYTLFMEIPNGYEVEELPKSARLSLEGGDGLFEYLVQKSPQNIQLRYHLKLSKSTFDPDQYSSLRDFFTYIVKKQQEQIVFKKK
jgi:hypothetical protein